MGEHMYDEYTSCEHYTWCIHHVYMHMVYNILHACSKHILRPGQVSIQMSGRASRRGIDERGIVIFIEFKGQKSA